MYQIKFTRLSPDARVPSKAHPDDAGFDVYASEERTLKAHSYGMIATGISMQLPPMTEAQVRPRSGLAAKHGVTVLNTPGTIDAGYRGEVKVILINHSDNDFTVLPGDRIAQMVIQPVYPAQFIEADTLEDTDRGEGGFGSSGR